MPPATFIDRAFALLDGPNQPLDCALILDFDALSAPTVPGLMQGAARAQQRYPKSACLLRNRGWEPTAEARVRIQEHSAPDASAARPWLEAFLNRRFQLGRELAIEEALVKLPTRTLLVFRMHHALGDLVSAAAWLGAQLGTDESTSSGDKLVQRFCPSSVRTSRYAAKEPSARLATAKLEGTGLRAWQTVSFPKPTRLIGGEFTYNDLLAAVTLQSLYLWNRERGAGTHVGLWLPVNVREKPFVGFGNGSGRIRVYRAEAKFASFREAAPFVREQVRWSKRQGEWKTPAFIDSLATRSWLVSPLIKALARRKGVDMGTAPFSHAESLSETPSETLFAGANRLDTVAQLYSAHPLALNAVTFHGKTSMTFTWDQTVLGPEEPAAFIATFERVLKIAFAELTDG